jgi:hypothetical protein
MQVQGEFLDVPGLRLTLSDAEQRFRVDRVTCDAVLTALADAKVLAKVSDGAYTRFFPPRGPRAARAALPHGPRQRRRTTPVGAQGPARQAA